MPQISKLKAQKNRKRLNVYLDGEYLTSLDLVTATKLGLKVGMTISQAELQKLVRTHQFEKLYDKAIHFLSYRPRSEKETNTYLKSKWRADKSHLIQEKNIKDVINKLKDQGLINDQEFTEWWIKQRQEFRPRGKRLLKQELRQKGINSDSIEEALSKLDDYDAALRVANKKMKSLKRVESDKMQLKLKSLLQRLGFDWQTSKRVVDELRLRE